MTAPSLKVQIQGQGTVSADNLNTYEQTCNTFADLRAFIGAPGVQVTSRGAMIVNDGIGGTFYWDPSAVEIDDNANIIVPFGAALGCWVRLIVPGSGAPISGLLSVASIADLRAIAAPVNNLLYYVRGYFVPEDGGGGPFLCTTLNPGPDDGGIHITSSVAGFYYIRQYTGPINVKYFGAVADADGAGGGTNCTPAFQATHDATNVNRGGDAFVPQGKYRLAGHVYVTHQGFKLIGEGQPGASGLLAAGSSRIYCDDGVTGFACNLNGSHKTLGYSFQLLHILGATGATGGNGITTWDTASCIFEDLTCSNFFAKNATITAYIGATSFLGTGAGPLLTVASIVGSLYVGDVVYFTSGTGIPPGTKIIAQISGTPNGDGVYQTDHNTTVSSTPCASTSLVLNVTAASGSPLQAEPSASRLFGADTLDDTRITSLITGTGGVGTYGVWPQQNVPSETMNASMGGYGLLIDGGTDIQGNSQYNVLRNYSGGDDHIGLGMEGIDPSLALHDGYFEGLNHPRTGSIGIRALKGEFWGFNPKIQGFETGYEISNISSQIFAPRCEFCNTNVHIRPLSRHAQLLGLSMSNTILSNPDDGNVGLLIDAGATGVKYNLATAATEFGKSGSFIIDNGTDTEYIGGFGTIRQGSVIGPVVGARDTYDNLGNYLGVTAIYQYLRGIALINHINGFDTSDLGVSALSIRPLNRVAAGNWAIVGLGYGLSGASAVVTFSDTRGNTYQEDATDDMTTGASPHTRINSAFMTNSLGANMKFIASVSGTTMVVTQVIPGTFLAVGQLVTGGAIPDGTIITAEPGGGGVGSYSISNSATIAVGTALFATDLINAAFSTPVNVPIAQAYEFSGLLLTSWLDQAAGAHGTSTAPSSGAVVTTDDHEMLFAFVFHDNAAIMTPGAGYVVLNKNENVVKASVAEYQIQAAAGSCQGDGTLSASVAWSAVLATYKFQPFV